MNSKNNEEELSVLKSKMTNEELFELEFLEYPEYTYDYLPEHIKNERIQFVAKMKAKYV